MPKKKKSKLLTAFLFIALILILIFMLTFFSNFNPFVTKEASFSKEFKKNELLIKFKDSVPETKQSEILRKNYAKVIKEIPQINVKHISINTNSNAEIKAKFLKNKYSEIEFVEPVGFYEILAVPNDPLWQQQWGLSKINAPTGWNITTGSSAVKIAIVDTGIDYTHPDLSGKIISGYNFVTCAGWAVKRGEVICTKPLSGGTNASDGYGHGTHVAGIASAVSNNDLGVVGTSWQSVIMPVKVLGNDGRGTYDWVAQGIIWAADNNADVISLSLGGLGVSSTVESALNYALSKDSFLACAAGNNDALCLLYPAAYPSCIAVGATNQQDKKAYFSNYGDKGCLDWAYPLPQAWLIGAPGVSTISTMPTYPVYLTTNYSYSQDYANLSGTSMATPHISGAIALALALNPSLTSDELRNLIAQTSVDLGEIGWDFVFGWGRIDLAAFLNAVENPPALDVTPPSVAITYPTNGTVISKDITVQISASDDRRTKLIEYYVDNVLQKSAGVSWLWHTAAFSNGTHILKVKVYDFGNNVAESSISVNIQNEFVTETFHGYLLTSHIPYQFTNPVYGTVTGELTWLSKGASLGLLFLYPNGATAAGEVRCGKSPQKLAAVLPAGNYIADVIICRSKSNYTLKITHSK